MNSTALPRYLKLWCLGHFGLLSIDWNGQWTPMWGKCLTNNSRTHSPNSLEVSFGAWKQVGNHPATRTGQHQGYFGKFMSEERSQENNKRPAWAERSWKGRRLPGLPRCPANHNTHTQSWWWVVGLPQQRGSCDKWPKQLMICLCGNIITKQVSPRNPLKK